MGRELWPEPGGGGWTGWDGQCSLEGGRDVTCTRGPTYTLHSLHSPRVPAHLPTLPPEHFCTQHCLCPCLPAHRGQRVTLVAAETALCCPASWGHTGQSRFACHRPGIPNQKHCRQKPAWRFPPILLLLDNNTTPPVLPLSPPCQLLWAPKHSQSRLRKGRNLPLNIYFYHKWIISKQHKTVFPSTLTHPSCGRVFILGEIVHSWVKLSICEWAQVPRQAADIPVRKKKNCPDREPSSPIALFVSSKAGKATVISLRPSKLSSCRACLAWGSIFVSWSRLWEGQIVLPATPFQALNGFICFLQYFLPMSSLKHLIFLLAFYLFSWFFFKVTFTLGTIRPISVYSNLQTCRTEWGQCRDCFSYWN